MRSYPLVLVATIAAGCLNPSATASSTLVNRAGVPESARTQSAMPATTEALVCNASHLDACEQRCRGGDPSSCFRGGLGFHGRFARTGELRDAARAVASYDRGCKLSDWQCCTNLGLMIEKGWGIERSLSRAAALYDGACSRAVAVACRNVGRLNEGDDGLPPRPEQAMQAYRRALALGLEQCEHGGGEGCAVAGNLYRDGKGTPSDPTRASELLQQACSMGARYACTPPRD
jgi:uncharacterized protein